MSLECELKYLNPDLDAVRAALGNLGAERLGLCFEENLVLDDPARSLKRRGLLLRLRRAGGKAILTVKRPARMDSACKVCAEHETVVSAFDETLAGLDALGFTPAFAYEKVREAWRLSGCEVCLDRLPFGDFVEIEGPEEALRACATALGLDGCLTSRETYHALNMAWRRTHGLPEDESFVFVEPERSRLRAEAGEAAGTSSEG
ncbi:class IV adenylate cyclase [Desulfovibrio aminophilus]|nr:class IV adenylate cyclase [Desulfovibrio aminophilus]MCM0755825.1 class IV adenylate cyclase [Desulfovibrio aminophilus]